MYVGKPLTRERSHLMVIYYRILSIRLTAASSESKNQVKEINIVLKCKFMKKPKQVLAADTGLLCRPI